MWCKRGDVVCWLPYGPHCGGGVGEPAPVNIRHTLPYIVVGKVLWVDSRNRPVILQDDEGVQWDTTVSPGYLYIASDATQTKFKDYTGDDFDRSG